MKVSRHSGSRSPRIGLVVALVALALVMLNGCETTKRRDMSNDLVPTDEVGYTSSVHNDLYYTVASLPDFDVVVQEDVTGYVNFTYWITNKTNEPVEFQGSLSRLSVRSRDGHGKTLLPLPVEFYLERVLKCYYSEKPGYEDYKTMVRTNYIKDVNVAPGKTVSGIIRFDSSSDRTDTYTLILPFKDREVAFRYRLPHQ